MIEGKIIRLVPFQESHVTPDYLGWLNDRHLMRFSRQRLVNHTRESSLKFLSSFRDSSSFFWAIERLSDGCHVGTMTTHVDTDNRTADLGILIGHASMAGTGSGREAWGLALWHGFSSLGLRKITGGTSSRNLAMLRVFQSWGMVLEGTQREQELAHDGSPADIILYGLLRAEWEAHVRASQPAGTPS
jgi:RimJ/RimL family protein N-acetyltransferase